MGILLRNSPNRPFITVIFILLSLYFVFTANPAYAGENKPAQTLFTTSAFGSDGRLWRVVPSEKSIAVDYSTDYGHTFSKPIRVNPKPQRMNFWDENPPSIAVDKQGKVYILYFADDKQEYTSFFSQSNDGIHFSKPVKVSSKANSQIHYQTEMWLDNSGKVNFLWHDLRDEKEYKKKGGGDLSIYHVAADPNNLKKFSNDHRIAQNICSCCRSAVALDTDGSSVVLARFVYPGSIRDHGLFKLNADNTPNEPWRVTFDNWKLDGCPTHGPALSISTNGRYHMAWFTQGTKQSGLFYAWSDDKGKTFSKPLTIGDSKKLPGRADVLALDNRVAIVWKEFDGKKTQILTMHSEDGGLTWSKPKSLGDTGQSSAHPALINDGKRIFLTWNTKDKGFQLVPVN